MTWDKTQPIAGSDFKSAPVRGNFLAVDEALLGANAKAQIPPDLTVLIAAFRYIGTDAALKTYAGGSSPSLTAPATNPRIAVLTIDDTGTLAWTYGTEAPSPAAPNYPVGKVALIEVYSRPGMTQIKDADDSVQGYVARIATKIVPVRSGGSDQMSAVRNLMGSAAGGSTIALTATMVTLRDPVAQTIVIRSSLSATLNVATAGPAVNGRDQAANFTNTWVHIYAIWNGTTLGVIGSVTAPPTGPTLPSGYTHWTYLTALHVGATANTWDKSVVVRGSTVSMSATGTGFLTDGAATAATAVSIASEVPPTALQVEVTSRVTILTDGSGNLSVQLWIYAGTTSRLTYWNISGLVASTLTEGPSWIIWLPNVSQSLSYNWLIGVGTSQKMSLWITGYTVPNGDV